MTDVLLFHHAHGLTPGVVAFADALRAGGHTVHVPDLYEGRAFDDLETGIAHAQGVGFDAITERGVRSADGLPAELVYAGFSLGALPAQKLAQTRPGAVGAVLISGCVPADAFDATWPPGMPIQVHGMDADPFFVEEGGDIDAARALVASVDEAELYLYPGDGHIFADDSLPSYDPAATELLVERMGGLLGAV